MTVAVTRLAALWHSGRKIVFLGVGSPLRADDSVGLYIVEELRNKLPPVPGKEVHFFLGEAAPENFSGAIRKLEPTHLVLIDAADFGAEPGTTTIIERDEIGGASFSTHVLPLKILTDYLISVTGCEVLVIGIQPKLLEFAYPMTDVIKRAADQLIEEFCLTLNS